MKKVVAALLLGLALLSLGCSKGEERVRPEQPFYSINLLPTLLGQNKPEEQPLQLHKQAMAPALALAAAYDEEIKALSSKGEERRRQEGAIAAKYLGEAKALRQQLLDPRDALLPYYRQAAYARQYLDALVSLLDSTVQLGQDRPKPGLAGRIGGARFNLANAALGYQHEYKLLTTGQGSFRFTLAAFRQLKPGLTYEQIRERLNMPGVHLKGSMVLKGKKPVRQDDWLWQYQSAYVYAVMENGRAVSYRQEGLY